MPSSASALGLHGSFLLDDPLETVRLAKERREAALASAPKSGPVFDVEQIARDPLDRPHPQTTFRSTHIDPSSFIGKIRSVFANSVLQVQLEQLIRQGSHSAFDLKWRPVYDVNRLHGSRTGIGNIPPSLFWESDIGKWIESVCYFMATDLPADRAKLYKKEMDTMIDLIARAQQPDGYLDIYFIVVDPEGKWQNLRDHHEMYNAGHLLEAALAHHRLTGETKFLNVMTKYVDHMIGIFGPNVGQKHGYPGHPELELAVLRLYTLTKDPKHLAFATYLLAARGQRLSDQGGRDYFTYEAEEIRHDAQRPTTYLHRNDLGYCQAHAPLHEQDAALGHSVRCFYLYTAAADLGGPFLNDARRIWEDAVDRKMYITGGIGSEKRTEGFSERPYSLPNSTDEGGCYAETCASIALMMTGERLLSHQLDGKVRDVLEGAFLNNVLGGGSLDGRQFSYANMLATCGDESALRDDWYTVCCCPPNLSRTLGMIGGYTWSVTVHAKEKKIDLSVYLFNSAERTIELPGGLEAKVNMETSMPWKAVTRWSFTAPEGWSWDVNVPRPAYSANYELSMPAKSSNGFDTVHLTGQAQLDLRFDMPVRLLAPHPAMKQNTLHVTRGPIVYTAEGCDNEALEKAYPHFEGIGLQVKETFTEQPVEIAGIPAVLLKTKGPVYAKHQSNQTDLYAPIDAVSKASWEALDKGLTFVPWFARANRGGTGHVRTAFERVESSR